MTNVWRYSLLLCVYYDFCDLAQMRNDFVAMLHFVRAPCVYTKYSVCILLLLLLWLFFSMCFSSCFCCCLPAHSFETHAIERVCGRERARYRVIRAQLYAYPSNCTYDFPCVSPYFTWAKIVSVVRCVGFHVYYCYSMFVHDTSVDCWFLYGVHCSSSVDAAIVVVVAAVCGLRRGFICVRVCVCDWAEHEFVCIICIFSIQYFITHQNQQELDHWWSTLPWTIRVVRFDFSPLFICLLLLRFAYFIQLFVIVVISRICRRLS